MLQVSPKTDRRRALTGVLATRSPDRPNPIGLHPVIVRKVEKHRILVGPIEAVLFFTPEECNVYRPERQSAAALQRSAM